MLTRRELVQNAMAFSVWPSLRPLAATALQQIQSEGAPDDETFWAYVRLEFELTPEFTNLVSVVRGNFTKANREIAFNEATRLNQLSAPLPDLNYQRETRRKVASFIGASAENIALLRNTTEGVTTVLSNWPVLRQNSMRTENSAIPCRDGCPIQVIPSSPSAKTLPGGTRAAYMYILKMGELGRFRDATLVRIRQPDHTGGAGLPVAH